MEPERGGGGGRRCVEARRRGVHPHHPPVHPRPPPQRRRASSWHRHSPHHRAPKPRAAPGSHSGRAAAAVATRCGFAGAGAGWRGLGSYRRLSLTGSAIRWRHGWPHTWRVGRRAARRVPCASAHARRHVDASGGLGQHNVLAPRPGGGKRGVPRPHGGRRGRPTQRVRPPSPGAARPATPPRRRQHHPTDGESRWTGRQAQPHPLPASSRVCTAPLFWPPPTARTGRATPARAARGAAAVREAAMAAAAGRSVIG